MNYCKKFDTPFFTARLSLKKMKLNDEYFILYIITKNCIDEDLIIFKTKLSFWWKEILEIKCKFNYLNCLSLSKSKFKIWKMEIVVLMTFIYNCIFRLSQDTEANRERKHYLIFKYLQVDINLNLKSINHGNSASNNKF